MPKLVQNQSSTALNIYMYHLKIMMHGVSYIITVRSKILRLKDLENVTFGMTLQIIMTINTKSQQKWKQSEVELPSERIICNNLYK